MAQILDGNASATTTSRRAGPGRPGGMALDPGRAGAGRAGTVVPVGRPTLACGRLRAFPYVARGA